LTTSRSCYKFQDDWLEEEEYAAYKFKEYLLKPSIEDLTKTKCKPCCKVMVSDIGVIVGHFKTPEHKGNVVIYESGSRQGSITNYTTKDIDDGVAKAQIIFSTFFASKHIPTRLCGDFMQACRQAFNDSSITAKTNLYPRKVLAWNLILTIQIPLKVKNAALCENASHFIA